LNHNGFSTLLSIGRDAKTAKSVGKGYLTAVQYLAPSRFLCPAADSCLDSCLFTSGLSAVFQKINHVRRARARFFVEHRSAYWRQLDLELRRFLALCDRRGLKPAVRPNGTSDVIWERVGAHLFDCKTFRRIRWYDYTKIQKRLLPSWSLPQRYTLTLSRDQTDSAVDAVWSVNPRARVSVVFGGRLPSHWCDRRVVDGDAHDLTFLHRPGSVIGLKAKGPAKRDRSGFVVWN